MTRESGAKRIFAYNWPKFAATWGAAAALALGACRLPARAAGFVFLASAAAVAWSLFSLLVSHYVYDRSELFGGSWVRALLPARVDRWTAIDAGLDAEIDLDAVMPGVCVARLDVFDERTMHAPSLRRARLRTPRTTQATRCTPSALPIADASVDVVTVVFSAHEIRDARARAAFFEQARRALRPGGRMLLVEHVRDAANFVAFGPGVLHFQPRAEWLGLARRAGLAVAREVRVTPWVTALALERPA